MGTANPSTAQHGWRSWRSTSRRSPARSTWYRARKPLPALVVVIILSVVTALAWVTVLNRADSTARSCAEGARSAAASTGSPVIAVTPGQRLAHDDLAETPPAPPQHVEVQVLNANGARGQASIVAADLGALGFTPTAEPANDPLHPTFDLLCHGEIRFGAAGESAARTLSLAVPCADLVRDGRPGSRVDLALGSHFINVRPNEAAHEALRGLTRLGEPLLGTNQGGQAATVVAPEVDPDLLHEAHQVRC